MTDTENIRIQYPDKFGIKEKLRNDLKHNPEFLELALKSHELLSLLQNQKLAITESLRVNKNVSIFEHQIRAAQRVKNDLGGSALLSDEVGLGKTVEAGIIIKEFLMTSLAKKVLILAPPSLLLQWQDEMISKFNLDFVSQKGDSRFTSVSSHNLLLMSHSSAVFPNYSEALKNIFWDIIVVDEAHSMKNSQTHKHKLVQNLSKRHLLLLSATPVQNNLSELYNIVELLRPGYLGTWNQFKEKYTLDDSSRRLNPLYREELQEILSKIIVRTTRKEVGKYIDFKERIPHTNILEPTEKESLLYHQITDCIREAYDASEDSNFLALMTYQRLAASSTRCSKRALYKMKMNKVIDAQKYDSLITIADQIPIDSKLLDLMKIITGDKSKFLIFTEFYATQDYVVEYLKEHGYSVT
ncbi:MAG: DEAD/DEAH box helicase, partial [Candidatus Nitrosopelagicus sp.]|nr:DEAD/DEAH box helicase [Candidatus Nitrosopelagicus sp.]